MARRRTTRKRKGRRLVTTRFKRVKHTFGLARLGWKLKMPVHFFTRVCDVSSMFELNGLSTGAISTSSPYVRMTQTTGSGQTISYHTLGIGFTLEDLGAYTQFTTLFDMYKIVGVSYKITSPSTGAPVGIPGSQLQTTGGNCLLHLYKDFDDISAPVASSTGVSLAQAYQSYRMYNLMDTKRSVIKGFLKPKLLMSVNIANATPGTSSTVAIPGKNPWLDTAGIGGLGPTTVYNGLKLIFEIVSETSGAYAYDVKIEFKYYLAFKDVR